MALEFNCLGWFRDWGLGLKGNTGFYEKLFNRKSLWIQGSSVSRSESLDLSFRGTKAFETSA